MSKTHCTMSVQLLSNQVGIVNLIICLTLIRSGLTDLRNFKRWTWRSRQWDITITIGWCPIVVVFADFVVCTCWCTHFWKRNFKRMYMECRLQYASICFNLLQKMNADTIKTIGSFFSMSAKNCYTSSTKFLDHITQVYRCLIPMFQFILKRKWSKLKPSEAWS